jgi:hypothetical protein
MGFILFCVGKFKMTFAFCHDAPIQKAVGTGVTNHPRRISCKGFKSLIIPDPTSLLIASEQFHRLAVSATFFF